MTSMRWAAALSLGFLIAAGCQTTPEPVEQPAPRASTDAVTALKAKWASTGALVGQVAEANERLATVEGIDAKLVTPGTVFHFVDAGTDTIIGQGSAMRDNMTTPSGRIVVSFDAGAKRAPQPGDLVVVATK